MPGGIHVPEPKQAATAGPKQEIDFYYGRAISYRRLMSAKAFRFVSSRFSLVHSDLSWSGSIVSNDGMRSGVIVSIQTRCHPNPDSTGPCQLWLDFILNSDSENAVPKILVTCSAETSAK